MKLIQQLERKLSWRSSQRNQRSHQPTTPGLAEAKQRKEKSSKKRAQQQLKQAAKNAAAVRVSDSEFSAYISFGSGLKTVPLNTTADSATSYQVVAIRTRAPFQSVGPPPPLLYSNPNHHHHSQSPSPRSEGHRQESDTGERAEHIYDRIDISHHHRPAPTNQHRRSCSLSPPVYQNPSPNWSPCSEGAAPFSSVVGSQSPTTSWGSNESGASSSSQCGPIRRRRNRIKTNPWLAGSPWATKALQEKENQPQENIYESIENLLSGSRRKAAPNPINQSYTPPFAQPPTTHNYYPANNQGTYLKRAARPTTLAVQQRKQKHLITETYPTSPYHLSSNSQKLSHLAETSPDDLHLLTSPSVEFLNQSQQLCRQISSYFDRPSSPANETSTSSRPSFERKESKTLERRESIDSMETIDLSPVNLKSQSAQLSEWSLAEENNQLNDHYQSKTVSSPAPTPPSPAFRSKRKLASPNMSRPESIYANSRKQSAKVDRLKCQLKEVVHAAIQQAKKKKV